MPIPRHLEKRVIERVYDLGGFAHPLNEEGHSIRRQQLGSLRLDSPIVKRALKAVQGAAGLLQDADPAEKTQYALFRQERCGCPDFGVMNYETGEVVAAATGRGGWSHSCNPDYPGVHVNTVAWDMSGCPSHVRTHFDSIWENTVKAYAEVGVLLLREDNNSRANHLCSFEPLRGSTIGLAILPQRAMSCSAQVWAKFDPRYQQGAASQRIIHTWTLLVIHELGHNHLLDHTRGGIMNPSLTESTKASWVGDPSERQLDSQYGGDPVDIPGDEPPEDEKAIEFGIKGSAGTEQWFPLARPIDMDDAADFLWSQITGG